MRRDAAGGAFWERKRGYIDEDNGHPRVKVYGRVSGKSIIDFPFLAKYDGKMTPIDIVFSFIM